MVKTGKKVKKKIKAQKKNSSKLPTKRKQMFGNHCNLSCNKPMPSLSELERMFEDSESEEVNEEQISDKLLEKLPILCQEILIDGLTFALPPLPEIPLKKRQKCSEPYIVGCKDRPRVPEKKSLNFGKGCNYGIRSATNAINNNDDCSTNGGYNLGRIQNSAFNFMANEVAAKLQSNEKDFILDSVTEHSLDEKWESKFSPLPSTSKDNNTILKNELNFCESITKLHNDDGIKPVSPMKIIIENDEEEILGGKNSEVNLNNGNNTDNDVFLYEVPEGKNKKLCGIVDKHVEISSPIDVESLAMKNEMASRSFIVNETPLIVEEYKYTAPPTIIDDIDLTDIDAIISENEQIINKYGKIKKLNTITEVKPQEINQKSTPTVIVTDTVNNKELNSITTQTNIDLEHVVKSFFEKHLPQPINNNDALCSDLKTLVSYITEIPKTNQNKQSPSSNNTIKNTMSLSEHDLTSQHKKRKANSNSVSQNDKPQGKSFLRTCPICLENISKNKIASTNCGHIFCLPCIRQALKFSGKRCPSCRKKLTGSGYHQIFL